MYIVLLQVNFDSLFMSFTMHARFQDFNMAASCLKQVDIISISFSGLARVC